MTTPDTTADSELAPQELTDDTIEEVTGGRIRDWTVSSDTDTPLDAVNVDHTRVAPKKRRV